MSSYIGATPTIGGYHKLDQITTDGSASYTMQLNSANFVPESVNHLIVSVNGVIQAPTDSFTVSGSTITFASSLSVSDTIDFIMALGNVLDIGTPSDSTVSSSKIIDGAVSLEKLSATGTKDATTFLRGDNTFAVPSGGTNAPYFSAYLNFDQTSITHETWTKVQINAEVVDEGGYFDTSNHRWTPPVGVYLIGSYLYGYDTNNSAPFSRRVYSSIRKNGSDTTPLIFSGISGDATNTVADAEFRNYTASISTIINQTNASDYWELWGYIGNDNGDNNNGFAQNFTAFWGCKLIGA